MPDVIQLLPDSIANQIAAGEVVQRPASVVKELLENSVDAGAEHITLIIKDAGKALVQVVDDGSGMSDTDARLSLERHATSKIRNIHDLLTLRTMGFRGEALASIAAVSQMEIRTRLEKEELGSLLVVEGSEVKSQEPVACAKGTSIVVKNLFYNIPARRNFLKSNPVEVKHITDEFLHVALAAPGVAFTFYMGDEAFYELPKANLSQRIVSIFGKNYQEQLAPCAEETAYVRVHGYVGKPEFAKRTRGEQFLFANNRFIRSNYLHHAVMNAFEGLLQESTFPFYVLFVDINPQHMDVNIHPTKTEVKFDDERAVYAVVRAAVRQSLAAHNLTPALDFSDDVNLLNKLNQAGALERDVYFEERFQRTPGSSIRDNWMKLFDEERPVSSPQHLYYESTLNHTSKESLPEGRLVVQLHNRYILCQVRQGLMMVNQELAHERVLYEHFMTHGAMQAGESQQSLFPGTIEFTPSDFSLVMEVADEIRALGFQFEAFGKNSIIITGYPAGMTTDNEKALFEALIEQFKANQDQLSLPVKESLVRALARRAAIKEGTPMQKEEMEALIARLMACKSPSYTPEGTPTFYIFDVARLEQHFSRSSR